MNPFFSIAIPCYEMSGRGGDFLNFSLDKIYYQDFKDFEVVISDHSLNNDVFDSYNSWKYKLDIKYIRCEEKKGNSSYNINNAIKNCNGKWIKILFQDDFLYHEKSLSGIKDHIKDSTVWLATASEHTKDGYNYYYPFMPKWNEKIKEGINTISSPSVITIKKGLDILFDENLIWLMDVDYYYRIWEKYGEPEYIKKINIVNRVWENSISNTLLASIKRKEIKIITEKYGK